MVVPPEAEASGYCGGKKNTSTQQINLSWAETDKNMTEFTLKRSVNITFAKNTTMEPPVYGVRKIEALYETKHYNVLENKTMDGNITLVNVTYVEYISMTSPVYSHLEFQTPLNRSFLCLDVGALELFADINSSETPQAAGDRLPNATFTAVKVQLDAFRPKDTPATQLQSPLDCSFRPSDVVPIVVGCALAGTVLLVLIAYLVGRRRNSARGYQSV
jgi:lysosomal-associated membrane protein 1/2